MFSSHNRCSPMLWSTLASIALHGLALGFGRAPVIVGADRVAFLRGELITARIEHAVGEQLVARKPVGGDSGEMLKVPELSPPRRAVQAADDGIGFASPHFVVEPDFSEIAQFPGVDTIRLEVSISVSMLGTAESVEVHSFTPVPDALLQSVVRTLRRQAYVSAIADGIRAAGVLQIVISDQEAPSAKVGGAGI